MRIKSSGDLGGLEPDQCKLRGWSQTQFAEKVGVSRLRVSQLENGKEAAEVGLVLQTLRVLELSFEAGLSRRSPFERGDSR